MRYFEFLLITSISCLVKFMSVRYKKYQSNCQMFIVKLTGN